MENKDLNIRFNKIKRLLDDENDTKMEVKGFYFNTKAIECLKKINKDFFINSYYNLTISDILNMVSDNNNVEEVKAELYQDYKKIYAEAWFDNFIEILARI